MSRNRRDAWRMSGACAAVAVVLSVAACGGSSHQPSRSAGGAAPAKVSNASATSLTVSTRTGPLGTYLVGPSGRALYLWEGDSKGRSNCSAACAQAWPPLLTTGAPRGASGAVSGDLGTVTRAGGDKQVTYAGHPLYYYLGDTGSGTTDGQGSDGFGARWWLVAPSGSPIQRTSSTSSSASSSSSSGSGYGG